MSSIPNAFDSAPSNEDEYYEDEYYEEGGWFSSLGEMPAWAVSLLLRVENPVPD